MNIKQKLAEAAAAVNEAWQKADAGFEQKPEVIITTGSGLGSIIGELVTIDFEMSYGDIPHLPPSRILGHAGRLIIGRTTNEESKRVVVLDGRVHGYEGHSPLTQILPLLIAHELCGDKAKLAIFTNAAGAINEFYRTGKVMLITDHINFTGQTVVEFNSEADFGGTNLDMTYVYTPLYRSALDEIARREDITLYQGVYLGLKGGMYETPAEIKAFRKWGADAVGMSTVHETTAASRLGLKVVGFSVLTNMAAGILDQPLNHEEVLQGSAEAAKEIVLLIARLLDVIDALS